ncbi:MAG: hypothetical protein A3J74_03175 [Elusimicrobia bacterium RIFCSPHIGHO2_02_FULL_57_9]|nr:MAG: hypothetical protein A3J74_03175 [Elusimicrobia bacterium RIFCSPHIGHO2_02_FULL_57_9]
MKKIVIVDDDPCMRELVTELLKPRYKVLSAEDGLAGLEMVKKEAPDLVVLDVLMPRMHGFEVCKRIRQDENLKDIKVLILSSKSYPHDIKTASEAGADIFVVKPFEIDNFLEEIAALLNGEKKPVKLQFRGTRGSVPAPGPQTQRYGGNTPCTELRIGNQLFIIDAGTGLRDLGNSLLKEYQDKPIEGHIFIGHTHWDHIQGFPFFMPLYQEKNKFTIYGAHGTTLSLKEVMSGQMNPAYFPVRLDEIASQLQFFELTDAINLNKVRISYHYLNHPGITIGFRFETKNCTLSYLSDHEPYGKLNNKGEFSRKEDDDIAKFVAGSDLLISEAQYTDEEYKIKKSWGHSTFSDVLGLAAKAKVKRLALFHHDPLHTDEMMDRFINECREHIAKTGQKLDCFGAKEGMTLSF